MDLLPVGIDPGLKGGAVLVRENYVLEYFFAPVVRVKEVKIESAKKRKRNPDTQRDVSIYDSQQAINFIYDCRYRAAAEGFSGICLFLEEPQSMQNRDSFRSYLSTGRCLNCWESAAFKAKVPIYVVNPKHWKSTMNLSSEKQESIDMARRLMPTIPVDIRDDDNMCEAALLAYWAQIHREDLLKRE